MKQYLLSIYQPDGEPPADLDLDRIMAELGALSEDMQRAGAWVFSGGLHPADTATVVHAEGADVLTTDGPYLEGKEHVGRFTIVRAPDLDAALGWARRMTAITSLPIEVRPFHDDPRGS